MNISNKYKEEAERRFPICKVRETDNIFGRLIDINEERRKVFLEGCIYAIDIFHQQMQDNK